MTLTKMGALNMKNILFTLITLVMISSTAAYAQQWATTPAPQPGHNHGVYPYPGNAYYGTAPYPYPAPHPLPFPMPYGYMTCFAQGLANGAYFYGIGVNPLAAQQWAMYACNSTGQYCQIIGCRY